MIPTLILVCLFQSNEIRELIERLRSDEPRVREEATRKLVSLGKVAEAELREVSDDRDREVADRARRLLERIEISGAIPEAVRKTFPDAVARAINGGEREWKELAEQWMDSYAEADLDALTLMLVHRIRSAPTKVELCLHFRASVRKRGLGLIHAYLKDPEPAVRIAAVDAAITRSDGLEEFVPTLLRDPNEGVRSMTHDRLREIRLGRAVPALIDFLLEGNEENYYALVRTLSEIPSHAAIPSLIRVLKSESSLVRRGAVAVLSAWDARAALPALMSLISDPDSKTAEEAIEYLAVRDYLPAEPELIELLSHPDPQRRRVAVEGLGLLGSPDAASHVRKRLEDPDPLVRRAAAVASARLGDPASIPGLIENLNGEGKMEAWRHLCRLKAKEAVPLALEALSNADHWVRNEAIVLLARVRAREHADKLVPILACEGTAEGVMACWALQKIGDSKMGPAIVELIKKAPEEAQSYIVELGFDLRCPGFGKALLPVLRDLNPRAREELLRGLSRDEIAGAAVEIVSLLSSSDGDVAERILRQRRVREAAPHLIKLLDHPTPDIRESAFRTLESVDRAAAAGELPRMLSDSDASVVYRGLQYIDLLEPQQAARWICDILRRESNVRISAIRLVGPLGIQEAVPLLRSIAKGSNPRERWAAMEPLIRVGAKEGLELLEEISASHDYKERRNAPWLWDLAGRPDRVAELLKDADPRVRENAMKYARDSEDLIRCLEDRFSSLRLLAALELSKRGDRRAISPLLSMLRSGSDEPLIVESLVRLEAKECWPEISTLLNHESPIVRRQAVRLTAQLAPRKDVVRLVERLDDIDKDVRKEAAAAVGRLGIREAIPTLARMLSDEDVAEALVQLKATEVVPGILRRAEIRASELEVLAWLAPGEATRHLRQALEGDSEHLRRKAIQLLVQTRHPEAVSMLKPYLGGPHEVDVAHALCRLGSSFGIPVILDYAERQGSSLQVLNWIRNPDSWKRLNGHVVKIDRIGSVKTNVENATRAAGLSADFSAVGALGSRKFSPAPPSWFAWDSMDWLECPDFDLIVDGNVVRVVSREAAFAFWKKWATERPAK